MKNAFVIMTVLLSLQVQWRGGSVPNNWLVRQTGVGTTTTAVTGLQWCLSVQFWVASRQRRPDFSDSLAAMVLALRPFHGYRSRYSTLPYNGPLTDDLNGVEYDPTQI